MIQGLLPFLGAGLGGAVGGGSGAGGILGGIGGGLLGLVGSAVGSSGTAFGGAISSIAGFLNISGAATLGIGAAIGGALLIGSYFLGRNSARRRDEKTRNQLSLDAFKNLDDLIAKVNADQIDGAGALEQAAGIRQTYMDGANALKDKKTRNIALKDVSRLDAKIETFASPSAFEIS